MGLKENEIHLHAESTNGSSKNPKRQKWSNQADYVLTTMGLAIGLGNIWRFPYLCFKNGGGAFFVPYFIFVVTCGAPLYFLETSFGQFTQNGFLKCWNIIPISNGIGLTALVVHFYCNIYYIIILAWITYYMFVSFQSPLPFSTCDNSWNTDNCYSAKDIKTQFASNKTLSVDEFWSYEAVRVKHSDGIDDPGSIVWHLALSLLVVWIATYFIVFKGIKYAGKAVYFTVLFPYVLIVCFIVRGLTLEGSAQGIEFYLKPDLSRLTEPVVWVDAASQVFFTYALCGGSIISTSSYNNYKNNIVRDSLIVIITNPLTSIMSGFAVFSVLGHLAYSAGVPVDKIIESGPGLIFKSYPIAVSMLPWSNFWSFSFFFMIFLLGFDGQFGGFETFVYSLMDVWPSLRKTYCRQALFTLLIVVTEFLLGLTMVTEGGLYVFHVWDRYAASGLIFLSIGLCEVISIIYIYGIGQYKKDIEQMIGFQSYIITWFNFCWTFLSPLIIISIMAFTVYQRVTQSHEFKYGEDYVYPVWAQLIGWFVILFALIWIPLYACYFLLKGRITAVTSDISTNDKPIIRKEENKSSPC